MTRGTLYLIDNYACWESTEFNGDMFPDGYGDRAFNLLHQVKNKKDFIQKLIEFNKEYEGGYPADEIKQLWECKSYLKHDFSVDYFSDYHSDWVFFKNISNKKVTFIDKSTKEQIVLNTGETARFRFGEFKDILYVPNSVKFIKELSKEKRVIKRKKKVKKAGDL